MHNTTYTQWVGKTLPALTIGALAQGCLQLKCERLLTLIADLFLSQFVCFVPKADITICVNIPLNLQCLGHKNHKNGDHTLG
ncbi:hypothetical protein KH388_00010 [Serratia rubidaea]|nr:hypothetical protein [Serratia rubidaea]